MSSCGWSRERLIGAGYVATLNLHSPAICILQDSGRIKVLPGQVLKDRLACWAYVGIGNFVGKVGMVRTGARLLHEYVTCYSYVGKRCPAQHLRALIAVQLAPCGICFEFCMRQPRLRRMLIVRH